MKRCWSLCEKFKILLFDCRKFYFLKNLLKKVKIFFSPWYFNLLLGWVKFYFNHVYLAGLFSLFFHIIHWNGIIIPFGLQSLERRRKLQADLAVEEHRGHELGRILKEILPDPKTPNVQKSRPGRKVSSFGVLAISWYTLFDLWEVLGIFAW